MNKIYRLRAPQGFKDGNIAECPYLGVMETVEVSEITALQMQQSDDSIEVLEVLIPNPRKQARKAKDE